MLEISGIGSVTAFAAGLISFLSPCVLPLVPGYVSYVAGRSLVELRDAETPRTRLSALALSAFFILGFSSVFIALGASASALGQLLLPYRYEANLVGGSLVILFGLLMAGALRIPWFQREFRFTGPVLSGHPLGAFVLGLAFAFGWTPCIGPVLGAILTVSASSAHVANGVSLLAIYSLGLAVPFLLAAAFTATFLERSKRIRRFGAYLNVSAGIIMIAMGIAMITGRLSSFAYWLLEAFPILSRIG